MAAEGTRVVLVKPGDLLLVGNVGDLGSQTEMEVSLRPIVDRFAALNVSVVFFKEDIELAKVPADG